MGRYMAARRALEAVKKLDNSASPSRSPMLGRFDLRTNVLAVPLDAVPKSDLAALPSRRGLSVSNRLVAEGRGLESLLGLPTR
jgi:hypothetical protein